MVLLPLSPLYHHHQYGSEKERENGQEINRVDQRIYLLQMRVYCSNISWSASPKDGEENQGVRDPWPNE